jgi:NTE family protein
MTVPRNPGQGAIGSSSEPLCQPRPFDEDGAPGVVLALGGGFSRGFAHLGVIEILEQEHVPIVGIVGTSIGSLLGAAFADGITIRELCDLGRRVRIRDFLRFRKSEPEVEINDRIGQFVRERFHSNRIEDLSIATSIVTTDLAAGAPYIFRRGPLDVAIRASCAFPGLFEPVQYQGRTLADGCIVAPVPTAAAAQMNLGCVLGVAVNSGVGSARLARNPVDGSQGERAMPRGARPSPSWIRDADLVLEPQVQEIEWSDFSRVEEAHAAGARAMRAALPRLRDLLSETCVPNSEFGRFLEPRMVSR